MDGDLCKVTVLLGAPRATSEFSNLLDALPEPSKPLT